MSVKDEHRIFVGGLSWETTDDKLEQVFRRFGKVIEAQVMLDRDTLRPRGFGFVTFAEARAVEDAITDMHNQELDGRTISVNKAQPKLSSDDTGYGYGGGGGGGGYSSGSRGGGYRGRGDGPAPGGNDCFKCGRPGHWARECPSAGGGGGGGGGGRLSSRSRFGGGGSGGGSGGGRGDRFGGTYRYSDRYIDDDRYDGGRYGDRDRVDSRDSRYAAGAGVRDRYASDRYLPSGDRFADRYGALDRYPQNGYGKERSYEREIPRGGGGYDRDVPRGTGGYEREGPRGAGGYEREGPRAGGSSDRYGGGGGGPARYEGGGYRDRPGPYDRPSRGGRPSAYDDRY
ncbi:glycine-rich RNA-binding protein RZ1C isoform X1 [Ananas comosus]|uniref:Glycine-rich RNA-binding protein RZ1C n=2 Tax=Ananas comosus TaxID=4615 RepID=A0A199V3T6_ANACO|nr:glycine-rich RNA-binding protein RZ1C isoform X1 [Ananas comosus]XP_020087475.1 glycine-rich RNA-binding protein RZ1C isoform X1 [Ananas comosus]OAY71525.1 Glycine-rich RNA-binding protein RZ1C [Ananas comosus]